MCLRPKLADFQIQKPDWFIDLQTSHNKPVFLKIKHMLKVLLLVFELSYTYISSYCRMFPYNLSSLSALGIWVSDINAPVSIGWRWVDSILPSDFLLFSFLMETSSLFATRFLAWCRWRPLYLAGTAGTAGRMVRVQPRGTLFKCEEKGVKHSKFILSSVCL